MHCPALNRMVTIQIYVLVNNVYFVLHVYYDNAINILLLFSGREMRVDCHIALYKTFPNCLKVTFYVDVSRQKHVH